jgi:hypothetical protein
MDLLRHLIPPFQFDDLLHVISNSFLSELKYYPDMVFSKLAAVLQHVTWPLEAEIQELAFFLDCQYL